MAKSTVNFKIDQEGLKVLFIASREGHKKGVNLQNWTYNCEANYEEYFEKQIQLENTPKIFTQLVNGQTIALTS